MVARLCGMRVERFSIGFGPPLLSFKRGGTIFQIAPIPLGGFVQITGLNPNEEFDKSDPMVYPNRPRWMRLAMVLAGPAANYLTAIVLVFVMLLGFGMPPEDAEDRRAGAEPPGRDGGAEGRRRAGRGQRPGRSTRNTRSARSSRPGQGAPVSIKVLRDGQEKTFTVTPDEQGGAYQVGIQHRPVRRPHAGVVRHRRQGSGRLSVLTQSVEILNGLYDMIRGKAPGYLSGPIGITKQIAKAANRGVVNFLYDADDAVGLPRAVQPAAAARAGRRPRGVPGHRR